MGMTCDSLVMDTLELHYGRLLGLSEAWRVVEVELSLESQRVVIRLEHASGPVVCPECGAACARKDHAAERSWRHLDTMQFETVLTARVPRSDCSQCGVKTVVIPWALPHGRFTRMFEAFAIRVLQAASNIEKARHLLRLSWGSLQLLLNRAVERGLARRDLEEVRHLGLDEKSFGRGQDYVSVMTDITGHRVLEVSEGRDEAAAGELWKTLSAQQKQNVEAVAIDMWKAFENSVEQHAPQAEVVHDRFHISKHLNEAVDKVRRQEHKALKLEGDETLTGTKQLWLFNPENLSDDNWLKFEPLQKAQLKTSRAWAIREQFRWFWEDTYAGNANKFFTKWYQWASRCQLPPIKKAAKMIKDHLPNILSWFRHPISNGPAEGFNSLIQALKSAARGFRNFDNYRTRILFFCGKLQLLPTPTS